MFWVFFVIPHEHSRLFPILGLFQHSTGLIPLGVRKVGEELQNAIIESARAVKCSPHSVIAGRRWNRYVTGMRIESNDFIIVPFAQ